MCFFKKSVIKPSTLSPYFQPQPPPRWGMYVFVRYVPSHLCSDEFQIRSVKGPEKVPYRPD